MLYVINLRMSYVNNTSIELGGKDEIRLPCDSAWHLGDTPSVFPTALTLEGGYCSSGHSGQMTSMVQSWLCHLGL